MCPRTYSLILIAVLFTVPLSSLAGTGHHLAHDQEEHLTEVQAKPIGGIYPLSVDPLGDSLVEVEKPFIILHNGRELRFATEANIEAFQAEPDKYLVQIDQLLILQQSPLYPMDTCIVSDQALGAMGEPMDYLYGNRLIRFCCKMCTGQFHKDPDKYLAKIDAAVIEAQIADYPTATCVVSGDTFGGDMGEPIDYVLGNRLVRLCCKMCIDAFEANPAAYLVNLEGDEEQGPGERESGHHQDGESHDRDNHH